MAHIRQSARRFDQSEKHSLLIRLATSGHGSYAGLFADPVDAIDAQSAWAMSSERLRLHIEEPTEEIDGGEDLPLFNLQLHGRQNRHEIHRSVSAAVARIRSRLRSH
jgi:hypothetical protein